MNGREARRAVVSIPASDVVVVMLSITGFLGVSLCHVTHKILQCETRHARATRQHNLGTET